MLTVVRHLVTREIRIEAAGRDVASTVAPFVVAAVLLAGLGFGPSPRVLTAVGPGTVWLVVLFAAAPIARGVAAAERDEGAWDLLRALTPDAGLLAGKTAGLWLQFVLTWLLALALVTVVFRVPVNAAALAAGPLGTLGLAALTTAFGALLVAEQARSGLLMVLLLPAALPVLLAGVAVMLPGAPPAPWLALLVAYDVLVLAVLWAIGPALLEE